ncbi:hypothetical protein BC936DRAFT_148157 [Jimgerdemannia flammicorona]|uniref:Major facilitator superfamily (MFS) profile domain-containing protein n=1 Tax=Jimgerdemannia flammicorona TaxID=994334 RepID=A0A433D3Q6_9FUNG|nr:hypothetical protein BC936DRAFT_148157 [Jimgerdemannia flammicorona]
MSYTDQLFAAAKAYIWLWHHKSSTGSFIIVLTVMTCRPIRTMTHLSDQRETLSNHWVIILDSISSSVGGCHGDKPFQLDHDKIYLPTATTRGNMPVRPRTPPPYIYDGSKYPLQQYREDDTESLYDQYDIVVHYHYPQRPEKSKLRQEKSAGATAELQMHMRKIELEHTLDVNPPQAEQEFMPFRQFILVFIGLALAMFTASLCATIVTVTMGKMASDMNDAANMAWIPTSYMLTSTAFSPIWGNLSDVFGRKIVLITAVLIFMTGSLLCAVSSTMIFLIGSRAIQGIGGGAVVSLVSIVIADLVPLRDSPKYQGLIGGVFSLSSVLGPILVSGEHLECLRCCCRSLSSMQILTVDRLVLRFCFEPIINSNLFIRFNRPSHMAMGLLVSTRFPQDTSSQFQTPCFMTHRVGLPLPVIPLPQDAAPDRSACDFELPLLPEVWDQEGRILMGQARTHRLLGHSLSPHHYRHAVAWLVMGRSGNQFALRGYSPSATCYPSTPAASSLAFHSMLCSSTSLVCFHMSRLFMFCFTLFEYPNIIAFRVLRAFPPVFYQKTQFESATASGLEMLPIILGLSIFSVISGSLVSLSGRFRIFIWIGMFLLTLGAALISTLTQFSPKVMQICYLLITGCGVGLALQTLIVAGQASVQRKDLAAVTSLLTFWRTIGGVLGTGLCGTIYQNALQSNLSTLLDPKAFAKIVSKSGADFSKASSFDEVARVVEAYTRSLQLVYRTFVGFAALALFATLFLQHKEMGFGAKKEENKTNRIEPFEKAERTPKQMKRQSELKMEREKGRRM